MPTSERKGYANLTLKIKRDGQDVYDNYTVIPFEQRRGVKLYKLVKAGAVEPYIVGYDREQGGVTCDCPDQTRNHPQGGCKHIKALKAFWIIF